MAKPKKEVKVEGYLKKEIKNPKNQAALEFIMTYGWAILVVLVSIGSLSYFGVLSPDRFLPVKCTLQPGIACLDHKATAASLIVRVQNSLGRDITVDRVTAFQCAELPSQGTLANNAKITFTFPACTNPGTKYHGQFNITYTAIGASIQHTNQGEITTRIEGQTTLSNITPDTTPPAVSITTPANGATVSGTIAVSAAASDNVGVVGVQFRLDGANLGLEDTTSPYSISWDTATASNGAHSLTAVARDAAGNTATSTIVSVTVSNVDTTPPSISAVTTSAVTTTTATITWTTNEPADTQVEYGLTTGYGSSTALNTTLATSHSQTISGLSSSTLYHYRALSRDAAGNLATSGDFNFTTASAADTIPPTVSITSPSNGATVNGTIFVNATATDNVGVVGVQFRLDGANLGAEDTTAPYSVSWDTSTASNGVHSLTATARDAAGNTATSIAVSVTVDNAVPVTGLVAHWKFDEGAGTTAADSSGNGNNGTLVNGPTWTTGKIGGAVSFDGVDDSVNAGNQIVWNLANTNHTLTAWFRSSLQSPDDFGRLFDRFTGGAPGAGYFIAVRLSPTSVIRIEERADGGDSIRLDGTANMADGNWHHIAYAVNINTRTGYLYVDGIQGASDIYTGNLLNHNKILEFGGTGTSGSFSGLMDDVRVYNRALTLTEIQQLANAAPSDTTVPNVSITLPSSGATVNGTIFVNATATDNVGVVGVQFRLDGSNLGAEDLTSPYSISWNTATASNGAHSLTAVARDAAGNQQTSAAVSVTVSNTDTIPPTRSDGQPTGTLAAGTTSTSISLTTNEAATCRYSTVAGTAYASMTNTFTTTGGTSHSTTVSGLTNGNTYNYYIRCQDTAGNANTNDFAISFSVASAGGVYYVDYETGSDANSGTSQSAPWRHSPGMAGAIGIAAATILQPGDIVYFKKGVVWPSAALPLTPSRSGTVTAPITYKAKPDWGTGGYAIFDAQNLAIHSIQLDNYNNYEYLVFDGLWLRDATAEAVFVRTGQNFIIQNCKATKGSPTTYPLIYTQATTSVMNCYIDGTNVTGEAVVQFQGAGGVGGSILSRSEVITGSAVYGVKLYDVPDGIVEKNYIHGARSSSQYLLVYRSSPPGTIRYNIIDARGGGVAIASWIGSGSPSNVGHKIYNNVLIGNGNNDGFLSPSPNYDGFDFINNIFYDFNICVDSLSDATIANNIFFSCNSNWNGGSFSISNNVIADPRLFNVNSLPTGTQLQSTSPAINAGITFGGYHNGVNTDYFGTTVPQGSAPDMGAYEFVSSNCAQANILCVDDTAGSNQEYATIQAAFDAAGAGDTILVFAGVYADTRSVTRGGATVTAIVNLNKDGTPGNPITIKAAEPGVILDGGGTASTCFTAANHAYLVIEGFNCQNFTLAGRPGEGAGFAIIEPFGISVPAHHITIRNNTITNIAADANVADQIGIGVQGLQDSTIEGNTINFNAATPRGGGIRGSYAERLIIQGNVIKNVYVGIYISQEGSAGSSHEIYRNYVQNIALHGIWLRDVRLGKVAWNVVEDRAGSGTRFGIWMLDNSNTHPNESHQVWGNTVRNMDVGISMGSSQNSIFRNNIITTSNYAYADDWFDSNILSSGTTIDYSLLYGNTNNYYLAKTSNLVGTNMIVGLDPLFQSIGNKPSPFYRLQSTSPARNAGDSTVPTGLDYDGTSVPQESVPDIGAFEIIG